MRQVILNFHGIGQPQRQIEPGEERYWVSQDFFEETLALSIHHKTRTRTSYTFDDGNLSDIEIAAPILAHYGIHATFFVLADRIGTPGSLSAADIRALSEAGNRIGTHGAAHIDWRIADKTTIDRELGAATRAAIADAAGRPVMAAAIPFGRYNRKVLGALSREGYKEVYSSDGGPWHAGQRPIPRTSPRADMTLSDIERLLIGPEPTTTRLRRVLARSIKQIL